MEIVFCTHWIEVWVGLETGLEVVEKRKFFTLPALELRPLGFAALPSRYTDYANPASLSLLYVLH
jgi:hypothetical protein